MISKHSHTARRLFLLSTTLIGSALAGATYAETTVQDTAGAGSEGSNVTTVVVTAERAKAAAAAPSKAPVSETQPQSIISRKFLEQSTPEVGDYSTTVLIAPSMAGLAANGGGVGETNKSFLRGFKDGEYNMTYDGVSFGDTNDPTHHTASYFPASTIGTAVVDRGPGVAGDLGQASYGGALHFFSPEVSDTFSLSQKVSIGSFNTHNYVTTLQSGRLDDFGGVKFWLNLDERDSKGELSYSGGVAQNQSLKIVKPLTDTIVLTAFASHNYTRFFQSDAGAGATWQQITTLGKDFALNNTPGSVFSDALNNQKKTSDFEYVRLTGSVGEGITWEDQAYTYFYSNNTISVDDVSAEIVNPDGSVTVNNSNISKAAQKLAGYGKTDLGIYFKGNRYRVVGNIARFNKDFSFGTLRIGGIMESSKTDRHNNLYDATNGQPDLKYTAYTIASTGQVVPATSYKTLENSRWNQLQVFADFQWRPMSNLTITPGVKYYDFTRRIESPWDAVVTSTPIVGGGFVSHGSVHGKATYKKPLMFLTGNYRILPEWSVYAQYGESFLTPALSTLQVADPSANSSKPTFAKSYQAGTVYSKGNVTADFDVYKINVSNLYVTNPTQICTSGVAPGTTGCAAGDLEYSVGQIYINAGNIEYSGAEGEAAYSFNNGISLFVNGSVNSAKTVGGNELVNAPKWTDATGVIWNSGNWESSLTYKEVGKRLAYINGASAIVTPDGVSLAAGQRREYDPYSQINAEVGYDFGRFKVKLAGYNLADHRTIISIGGNGAATDLYQFQAGRQVMLTLQAKY